MKKQFDIYLDEVSKKLLDTDASKLAEIADIIIGTKTTNKAIFTAGNGGSASTASHIVNDLIKGCRVHGREGFDAFCLSDSNAVVTCLANDFCYEDIFSIQLKTHAKKGDVLIVYSGSGNSPNIVSVCRTAKEMGMKVIGFGGRDGGAMLPLCDVCLLAPTDSMEQLEDMHLIYEHALVSVIREALSDMWGAEILHYPPENFPFKVALFDFDGTVSLIREGWQEVMVPYFIEVLLNTPRAESKDEIASAVRNFVDILTGKQTIFQCIRLDEEVVVRGGEHVEPIVYKNEYLKRLMAHIEHRHEGLKNQTMQPSELCVPGCTELFERLKQMGVEIILASGTDEDAVIEEARLLDIEKYFDGQIYGAHADMTECSKELVIKDILEKKGLNGEKLLSFGDGYVEIELVKNAGGYSVAVATDEVRKLGINQWKRERLIKAGADMVIPDFADVDGLIGYLKG